MGLFSKKGQEATQVNEQPQKAVQEISNPQKKAEVGKKLQGVKRERQKREKPKKEVITKAQFANSLSDETSSITDEVESRTVAVRQRRSRRQDKKVSMSEFSSALKSSSKTVDSEKTEDRKGIFNGMNSLPGEIKNATVQEETEEPQERHSIFKVKGHDGDVRSAAVPANIAAAFGIKSTITEEAEPSSLIFNANIIGEDDADEGQMDRSAGADKGVDEELDLDSNSGLDSEFGFGLSSDSDLSSGSADTQAESLEDAKPGAVVDRLRNVTKKFREMAWDGVQAVYYDGVDSVNFTGNTFKLANDKVYVNGKLQNWDDAFEVRCDSGAKVEIETGVGFQIPKSCALKVMCTPKSEKKFYFKSVEKTLTADQAFSPITLSLEALDGAYLSQVGRIIECQVVEL